MYRSSLCSSCWPGAGPFRSSRRSWSLCHRKKWVLNTLLNCLEAMILALCFFLKLLWHMLLKPEGRIAANSRQTPWKARYMPSENEGGIAVCKALIALKSLMKKDCFEDCCESSDTGLLESRCLGFVVTHCSFQTKEGLPLLSVKKTLPACYLSKQQQHTAVFPGESSGYARV